jgi:Na+-driven multidrug efflux pump
MIVGSLGIAVTTFVGQNYGAGRYDRVRKTVRQGMIMTLLFTVVLSAVMFIFRIPLLSLFAGKSGKVIAIGDIMMQNMVPFYVLYVSIEVYSGALRGMGDTLIPTILSLLGICLLRIIWIGAVLPMRKEVTTVVWSYPVTWTVTSVLYITYYFYTTHKKGIFKKQI